MRQHGLVVLGAAFCTSAALSVTAPQVTAATAAGPAAVTVHPAAVTAGATDSRAECSYISSTFRPELTHTEAGAAVMQAQCLSNMWGGEPPKLTVDGSFDTVMLKKIKWIQGCHGLPTNGVVDTRTWQVLYHPAPDCYRPYPA
ncbi:hypothetical protein ADL00_01845 [Streptomyces sp. AS58]|uniref:Peptidoglycan-binding protein n=1 Tax=Streptomyces cadmiisoli TaxID=2184053 RepID=A0A2Z4ISX1_9ACTN|nr:MULTISPECIES: peptidoglycan-binding domain-containing protein [Streptomyces]AWW36072.1 peptidoglycan-binding protein [Streptomyces cadmiisoli]KOV74591.1 hypothetical protein ADL00_01845 [Streptomyces sp. AS58]